MNLAGFINKVIWKLRSRINPEKLDPYAARVTEANLTYLGKNKLISLQREIGRVKSKGMHGDVLELGVALGGSAIFMSHLLRDAPNRFYGFDVFGMIPPPSSNDNMDSHTRFETIKSGQSSGLGGDEYYGYVDNLFDAVVENFNEFNLPIDGKNRTLVKGLFEDTLKPESAVAFAHIDCDWYDPVTFCLQTIWPKLEVNGRIVLDDYNNYEGCKKATQKFMNETPGAALIEEYPHGIIEKTQ